MKLDWNKKYTTIAIYVFLVILFAVFCVFFFVNYNNFGEYINSFLGVFRPIIFGIMFAYLLNPVMKFFERNVFGFLEFKHNKLRLQRGLAVLLTFICLLLFLLLIVWIVVPQVTRGYTDLAGKMGFFIESLQVWLEETSSGDNWFSPYITTAVNYLSDLISKTYEVFQNIMPVITTAVKSIVVALKDIGLGLIFSIYFLLSKETLTAQVRKTTRAAVNDKMYELLKRAMLIVNRCFGEFLLKRIVDSLIIAVLMFLAMLIIGVPYYPLLSFILFVMNIIPVFGPIMGAIVTGFIVLISPGDMLIPHLITLIIIYRLDARFISPKISGRKSGLSTAWIFIAITLMTGFFGVTGMLIGVPVFAIIYTVIKSLIENRLETKGAPAETYDYLPETGDGRKLYEESLNAEKISNCNRIKRAKAFKSLKNKVFKLKDKQDVNRLTESDKK